LILSLNSQNSRYNFTKKVCKNSEKERYSTSTKARYAGAVAGRGSGPAVGFLRGEALPRLGLLVLLGQAKRTIYSKIYIESSIISIVSMLRQVFTTLTSVTQLAQTSDMRERGEVVAAGRRWVFAGGSFAKTTVFVTFCLQKVREIIFNLLLNDECRVTEVVLI